MRKKGQNQYSVRRNWNNENDRNNSEARNVNIEKEQDQLPYIIKIETSYRNSTQK